jgi:L-seryl-tRNA(Ser) seleniumtransferase
MTTPAALRSLPSVDRLLREPEIAALLATHSRDLVVSAVRAVLDGERALRAGGAAKVSPASALVASVRERLDGTLSPSLQRVVNATGVILHTNLGRALLAEEAVEAVAAAARETCNVEFDIAAARRGERDAHVEGHLLALTGAEAATVVNNNAAAVLLALDTLAAGREVLVSRGELVEIGGSFRLPEILAKSGAVLREVGTTNRTHLADYASAIGERTALLLKVHPSNYRIEGFTSEVGLDELVALGRERGLPVMEDLGSGALVDLAPYGVPHEPVVADRVRRGADVVTFSGDKLLGGPQAGIAVGRAEVVERMRRNPLKRALRCDKLTLAALEATLRLYRGSPDLAGVLPTLRTLARPLEEVEETGRAAAHLLADALGRDYDIELIDSEAEVGSGAAPTRMVASKAIAVRHPSTSALEIAARFRAARPPILGRIHDGRFLLDLRCIRDPAEIVPR